MDNPVKPVSRPFVLLLVYTRRLVSSGVRMSVIDVCSDVRRRLVVAEKE